MAFSSPPAARGRRSWMKMADSSDPSAQANPTSLSRHSQSGCLRHHWRWPDSRATPERTSSPRMRPRSAASHVGMGRADARIHVEHDGSRRTAAIPCRSIGRRDRRAPTGSFPSSAIASRRAHLACRRGRSRGRFAADDPARRRIMAKPFRVVDVLASGQSPEHRLPQRMPAVLASAGVGEPLPAMTLRPSASSSSR